MRLFIRILIFIVCFMAMSLLGGYVYFDKKFTPKENNLLVVGDSGNIPIVWQADENSTIAALLLPVTLQGIPFPLYMQVDTGSPNTLFYEHPLQSILSAYPGIMAYQDSLRQVSLTYALGAMQVSSTAFDVIRYGQPIVLDAQDSIHIIGTIGNDLLEKRISILDFGNAQCIFTEKIPSTMTDVAFQTFTFNKRRILLPGKIDGEDFEFLFDTGTSAYSLITSKEMFEKYADENSKEVLSGGNSWGNTLSVYTKASARHIDFGSEEIPLSSVTYIEGTSFIQDMLMRFSGMDGMIGNRLFMEKTVVLDCANEKFVMK